MQVVGGGAETKGSCDQIYNELEADLVVKLITTLISVSLTLCCTARPSSTCAVNCYSIKIIKTLVGF